MARNDVNKTFFCIVQAPGSIVPSAFQLDSNLANIVDWAEGSLKEADEKSKKVEPNTGNIKDPTLRELMTRISDSGHQQLDLVQLLSQVRAVFPMTMAKNNIVDKILKEAPEVKSGEGYRVLEIEESTIPDIIKVTTKITRATKGLNHLPNAMLLSMVSTFDSQMSDIVRSMLKIKSDRLRHGQRQVSLSSIMAASSLQDLIDEAVNDEVYQFSRNSHEEQIKYIEEHFSIEIIKHWKKWPDLIEIFETRNLVAHGEKFYTTRYSSICTRNGHKGSDKLLGHKVTVSSKYLQQSLSILTEFATLTIFSLWRKHVPNEEADAFAALNEVAFDSIESKRYSLGAALSEFALSLKNTSIKEAIRLMFVVNLANAQFHMKNDEAAKKILDGVDWSATADNFKICVAALRKDTAEVVRLMPMIAAGRSIESDSFRTWPVFDFIKDDQEFLAAFKAQYCEDYYRGNHGKMFSQDSDQSSDLNETVADGNTRH